jgi:hypothetical protein
VVVRVCVADPPHADVAANSAVSIYPTLPGQTPGGRIASGCRQRLSQGTVQTFSLGVASATLSSASPPAGSPPYPDLGGVRDPRADGQDPPSPGVAFTQQGVDPAAQLQVSSGCRERLLIRLRPLPRSKDQRRLRQRSAS